MRRVLWIAVLPLLSLLGMAQGEYAKPAVEGDFVVRDFKFHTGESLPELHLHYASWGAPRRNAAGEITNAALLLHGTMGAGINWDAGTAEKRKVDPVMGAGGALDIAEYYIIAPDTIGSGKSSKPSDGLRMKFPKYNLEDIVAAERLLVEHLGVKHVVVIAGASMGGRQAWQWGVQYHEFMDALVPMISSPFPNAGRRGVIDFLPEAIIKADPAWKDGNYEKNPDGARLADITYSIFLQTPTLMLEKMPTRDDTEKYVKGQPGRFGFPDANDFIYMMELSNGFDAWSQIDRIKCPVLMINMAGDNMVPVELHDADKVTARLKSATYLEIKEDSKYGHGALGRTTAVWGPKMKEWLRGVREEKP